MKTFHPYFILTLFFLFACFIFVHAQNDILYEELPVSPLESVDWKNNNAGQIGPFREILRSYNLIVLAESTHLDGTVYDAQCMIAKELIEAGLINTIYTESSCINIERINKILQEDGKDGIEKAKYYAGSAELSYWISNEFFDYLANKIIEKKIRLVGIDIETTADTLMREMLSAADLLDPVKDFILKYPHEYEILEADFKDVRNWYTDLDYTPAKFDRQKLFVDLVISTCKKEGKYVEARQWDVISKYLFWRMKRRLTFTKKYYFDMPKDTKEISKFFSLRDSMMADIMLDDYTTHINTKAVVITTSYHSQRRFSEIPSVSNLLFENTYILGNILDKRIGEEIYNVCFVTSSGIRGQNIIWNKEFVKVQHPEKGSFENYFKKSRHNYFFVDLQKSPLKDKYFKMKVLFPSYLEAPWSKIFQGVFFIKKMYPVTITADKFMPL